MRARIVDRVQRRVRSAAGRRAGGAIILLYHRVADLALDTQQLAVAPAHFAEHLAVLRRHYRPLRLLEFCMHMQRGTVPPRSVVVTFDDGYRDNLEHAKPLLAAADIPATVFVTSSYVDSDREFWWDELERFLLEDVQCTAPLRITVGGDTRCWKMDNSTEHRIAYNDLHAWLRPRPTTDIDSCLAQMRQWANSTGKGRPSHGVLTASELCLLAADGLVEIGAHTATHPCLGRQPRATQWEEISGSKRRLEDLLGRQIQSFSYPFGNPHVDYTSETRRLARAAGFTIAVANYPGRVSRWSHPFEVPRHIVRNWDGATFERQLSTFFS